MLTLAKFGGTSMGSAKAMRQAVAVLSADPSSRLIVVSALSGVTDRLVALSAAVGSDSLSLLQAGAAEILRRHQDQLTELSVPTSDPAWVEVENLARKLEALLASPHTLSLAERDALLSFGERLSSSVFAAALRAGALEAETLEATQVLRTDSQFGKAEPETETIRSLAQKNWAPLLQSAKRFVTQGFVGATTANEITTLGRGGSDLSAALLGEALGAQAIKIWTDVPGVFSMDPNLVKDARRIDELAFDETAELANFGAKVLHPATLAPAMRARIPVFVGSTFAPEKGGTWIRDQVLNRPLIRAIALRKRQTLITVSSLKMVNAQGFLARMFSVLAKHQLSVDLVTTSEVSVSLTIDPSSQGSSGGSVRENTALLDELKSFSEVKIEENLTLVALIGNQLLEASGVAARAFQSVTPIAVRLICFGASHHNLCFLVAERDAPSAAQKLHAAFIET